LAAICQQFLRKAEFLCRKDPEAQALPTRLCAVLAGRAPLSQTGYLGDQSISPSSPRQKAASKSAV
jgi:hypothetical protein